MKLASLFDGIGGWLLAAQRNGITPVWASEVDPFCVNVTKQHFEHVQHFGDVSKIDGANVPMVDIVTAGSPCQDLSIAGKRAGLKGERSGLFHEAIRLFYEMREASGYESPRFFIWENVPGAFTSNKGHDFRAVLESITKEHIPMPRSGKWSQCGMVRSRRCDIAWRTLDAQFFGVAQRRRRIFLIADFGEPAKRRPEILFESESVRWHFAQSERTEHCAADRAEECFGIAGNIIDRKPNCGGNGKGYQRDISYTLNTADRHAVLSIKDARVNFDKTPTLRSESHGNQPVVFRNSGFRYYEKDKNCASLKASGGVVGGGSENIVAYDFSNRSDAVRTIENKTNTLTARMGTGDNNVPCITQKTARRLTPLECERLQGLPDNWTKFGSDTKRYKAIGNGMAQPCADFVMAIVKRMMQ